MVVEGIGLEALALHGGQTRRSRRPMASTDIYHRRVVADGGEAGLEARVVGV